MTSAIKGLMIAIPAAMVLWVQFAGAGTIPGISSVQDMINLNAGGPADGVPQGGIVINGLRYYDFQYAGSGTSAPTSAQIQVQTAPGPAGDNGLQFSFNWVSAGGSSNMDSTIRYKVHLESSVPTGSGLNRVGLFFDGDVPTGPVGTFAQVQETARDLNGLSCGTLGVFDDGAGPGTDVNQTFLSIVPPQLDLDLSKAIRVNSTSSGVATISIVDNTFRVGTADPNGVTAVPAPAAVAAGTMLLSALGVRKLLSRHSVIVTNKAH